MRFLWIVALALISSVQGSSNEESLEKRLGKLAAKAYDEAYSQVQRRPSRYAGRRKCTAKNLRVRREWGSLSKSHRKSYIRAVQCLNTKPALTPSSLSAGAKSRSDDFVVTHINQSLTIHFTASFLSWHRYFTWSYEEALREECGFRGDMPYWDWTLTARDGLLNSPMLDGSETSMSGNGADIGQSGKKVVIGASSGLTPLYMPTSHGGGCVTSGPFGKLTVNLGPVALESVSGMPIGPPSGNGLDWNPRCLKRDLVNAINQRFANVSSVVDLIVRPRGVGELQMQMQGVPGTGEIGVHGGGHFTLGGDPGYDMYVSPSDPAFYLHHAMIDRVWWIWQQQDSSYERQYTEKAISGTRTFLNMPPSANGTLDDEIEFGYAARPARPIRDLLSTVNGPFCYVYL